MENKEVITNLKKCITELESDITIIAAKRDAIPSDNDEKIHQRSVLTQLLAKMIAEQNSLESILREREAVSAGFFPPLDEARAKQLLAYMQVLNVVIQADQQFDRFVAIANGIKSAADEINKVSGSTQ